MTTTPRSTSSLLRRAALAVGGAAAAAVMVAGAGAAHASNMPPLGQTQNTIAVHQDPCAVTLYGCPVSTTYHFYNAGYSVYAVSKFPANVVGPVSYTLKCGSYTKTKSVSQAQYQMIELADHQSNPTAGYCDLTQRVRPGFTTTTKSLPPDSDELWPVAYIEFKNV